MHKKSLPRLRREHYLLKSNAANATLVARASSSLEYEREIRSRIFLLAIFAALCAIFFTSFAQANNVSAKALRIDDASQFEFEGTSDWKYSIRREGDKSERVTLRLLGLKSEELAKLRGYSDPLIKDVKVNENGVDGMAEITFSVSDKVDFFEYMTDQPSRLIVDFFPKDPTKKVASAGLSNLNQRLNSGLSSGPIGESAKKPVKNSGTALKRMSDSEGEIVESVGDGDDDSPILANDISEQITGLPGAKAGKNTRSPAGSDLPLAAGKNGQAGLGGQKEEPLSLAEKVSSEQGFSHGVFDGGDPEFKRFEVKEYEIKESAILSSRANLYIPFPMLSLGLPQLKSLVEAEPQYEIIPNETRENKEARVIMSLFAKRKYSLFTKISDEFLKRYPKSEYDEIIRYMQADMRFEFWRKEGGTVEFDKAMNQYQLLTEKYPDSPATKRTLLLMGYSYMDRGDSFGALKSFQRFVRTNPSSKHVDQVKITIAEAYLRLNRFDDAYDALDEIEKIAKNPKIREDAAFRKGDVFFRKKDWPKAIEQYKAAASRHPEAVLRFPNAQYNSAEAQFNLGNFKAASDEYRDFVRKFPDSDHGGYALTRIGEILEIVGAGKQRAQGAFLESTFRYRASPGAGIARMRLLTERMTAMKDKELDNALREIKDISQRYSNHPVIEKKGEEKSADGKAGGEGKEGGEGKAGEKAEAKGEGGAAPEGEKSHAKNEKDDSVTPEKPLELSGIEDFAKLAIADGFTARREYDRSAKDLIAYYQKFPQSPNKSRFLNRIAKNMTEAIRSAVDSGDFIEALRRWSRESDSWLKNTDRVDVRHLVGRAYEQAGVFKEADAIYRENLKALAEIKNSGKEKDHSIYETLPQVDAVNLRLAAVADRSQNLAAAEAFLKNIPEENRLSDAEKIERAQITADVAEARGQIDEARKAMAQLIATWKGEPELTSPLDLRLAKIYSRKRQFQEAEEHLAHIMAMRRQTNRVPDDVYASAMELRAENYLQRGRREEAVNIYANLLNEYESKRPLSSIRYKMGQVLFEQGDLKGAQTAWSQLSAEKDGMWAGLAQEQMQGAKWQHEYKKYLNRIPAAAEMR